jgi:hypothetical protein
LTALPKSTAAATRLLERHAEIEGRLAGIDEKRSRIIVKANAAADNAAAPLIKEIEGIAAAIESWWRAGGSVIAGDKKSTELGGCKIGLRTSRPKLAHGFESDDKAIEALRGTRWAKRTTRVSYSLDRTGTLKLLQLGGKAASDVASLGFSIEQDERFFLERTG